MPSIFPTPSHLCRIAEPPQPACGLPVQSKRIRPKTSFPHRFPHSSRLGLPAWLLLSKRDRRLIFTLSHGLESTNRRFVLRRPDHVPNGVVSTIFKPAISLRDRHSRKGTIPQSSLSLSSSGVARRAMNLSYFPSRVFLFSATTPRLIQSCKTKPAGGIH